MLVLSTNAATAPNYRTFAELVKYAKANPGKISWGSSGIGGPQHLAGSAIRQGRRHRYGSRALSRQRFFFCWTAGSTANDAKAACARMILPAEPSKLKQQQVAPLALISKPERYNDREEKVSAGKLHATQYVGRHRCWLVLAAGMWRLQVLGADNYRLLAEANRIRKVLCSRRAARSSTAKAGCWSITTPPSPATCCASRSRTASGPAADRRRPAPARRADSGDPAPLRRAPKYQPIPLKQDITPDEQAFIEAHRNELPELETLRRAAPPLSAGRLRRAPDRLRRRGLRADARQRLTLCLLRARRRGRQVRRGSRPTTRCCAARTARAT